jgi:predicted enzyme related to lactoylglutathione lyase
MINFRVDNLIELIAALKEEGIETAGDLVEEEYGKFSWIVDPEGNKIELWQPYDDKL